MKLSIFQRFVAALAVLPLSIFALPSVKIGTAELIATNTADSYYSTSTTATNSLGTSGRAAELVELARALGNDPDRIYDYVHNNIDVAWMYGLQKGALGALTDRSGTAFDQAQLMVELLRQAGYPSATYQAGTIRLTGAQFAAWTGISDPTSACKLLSSGGIPAAINGLTTPGCSYTGTLDTVKLGHAWVSVVIGGTSYSFDPAYKTFTVMTGVNLATATGFVAGQALTQATTGMSSGTASTVSYVKSLNSPALFTLMDGLRNNLLNYIQSNLGSGTVDDLVGGRRITYTPSPVGGLRQTSLPYPTTVQRTWSGDIPDAYRTTLRVQLTKGRDAIPTYTEIVDKTLYVDEIASRKLIFTTNFDRFNFVGSLRAVNDAGAGPTIVSYTDTTNPGYSVGALTLTVNHPYAASANNATGTAGDYMDVSVVKQVRYAVPMIILQGWGDVGPGLVSAYGAGFDKGLPLTPPNACELCGAYFSATGSPRREGMAAGWLAQATRASRLHAALANSVYAHHHSVGVVSADTVVRTFNQNPNGTSPDYLYTITESFDRIDVESAFSLTSNTGNASARRAAIHAIAASSEALEGSVVAQSADLPDTSSTATRFEWGNRPTAAEDPSGSYSGVPRRFYQFNAGNVGNANPSSSSLLIAEGQTANSGSLDHTKLVCMLVGNEIVARRNSLFGLVNSYAQAGFSVLAPEEAFLGPGQRCGAFQGQGSSTDIHSYTTTTSFTHSYSKQRGTAMMATRYVGGEPVEIAHIVSGEYGAKGGGGGVQPTQQSTYDPAQSAALLKSRFVDRSKALGVDLVGGALSYVSPASLSVGSGDFPYSLSAQLIWRGGAPASDAFGPVSHVEPQAPWTTNWNNNLSISGNGMEAMGESDIRAAAGTVIAFLVAQDIFSAAQSPERDVAGVLAGSWWIKQMTGNVVTVSVGADARQFLRIRDNPNQWVAPGAGRYTTLTQTGNRVAIAKNQCNAVGYPLSRGWDDSSLAFSVTNAQGDVQSFPYWTENFIDGDYCADQHGFRMSAWTFPQGVSVTLQYAPPYSGGGSLPELTSVTNSLGKRINFIESGLGGFNNGLSAPYARSVGVTQNADASTTHTDPAGEITRIVYSNFSWYGKPAYLRGIHDVYTADNSGSPSLRYDYDSLRRVSQAWDGIAVLGNRSPYQFLIANGARGERIDPSGNHYAVRYDLDHRAVEYTDELNRVTQASYDGRDRVTQYIYPENDQELLSYDNRNNLVMFQKVDKTGANRLKVKATYHPQCNLIETLIDPAGNVSGGNAAAHTTTWSYDAARCLLNSITQPTVFDAVSGTTRSPITSYTYNSRGQPATQTDPTGVVTQSGYDDTSTSLTYGYRTSSTLDPGTTPHINLTTLSGYDPIGNVTSTTDGRGKITTAEFDNDRRMVTMTGPATTCIRTENTYTGGLLTKTRSAVRCTPNPATDTDWQVTRTTYTATRQPEIVTDNGGYRTITSYDANDRVSDVRQCLTSGAGSGAMCPGPGRTTHTSYYADGAVNQIFKAWQSADQITYSTSFYTANGQLDSIRDANNNSTDYSYDDFDRLSRTTLADTSYEQYGYDANGNTISKRNRSGQTITWDSYDALNRETVRRVPANPAGNFARTLTTTYDLASRKWDATADGQTLQSRYDTAGRLTSIADTLLAAAGGNNGRMSYTYDGAGNRSSLTVQTSNSLWAPTYHYDDANRLQTVDNTGTLLASYSLDPLSRSYHETLLDGSTVDRGFQANGDLQSLSHGFNGGSVISYGYTSNGAHQILTQTISDSTLEMRAPAPSRSFSVNALNQYTAVSGSSISYDGNGNLTGDGVFSYQYDEENRLRSATGAGHSSTYAYDPFGRRRSKTVDGLLTNFIHDGQNELAEVNAAGQRQRLYLYGDGPDQHIAMYTDATGSWDLYHGNHQGSTVALSRWGANGTNGTYRYDAYGQTTDAAGGNPFRYTGRYLDAETGLYYYRARYYSPNLGRFLQTDPIGSKDDLNVYAYVGQDPLNNTDPSGLCETPAGNSTCIEASTFNSSKSNGQTTAGNAATDKAAVDGKSQVAVTRGGTEEKIGFIVKDGNGDSKVAVSKDAVTASTQDTDTATATIPRGAEAVIHGHIDGVSAGLVDDKRGIGDSGPLKADLPNYTVSTGRVGVHEIVGGKLQFRMVDGTMTATEMKQIQQNINRQQGYFTNP